jgi:GMP synthase (glutamine-hydrolysing)
MTTPAPGHDTVLVLDFGAQYAQLIARRIRECNVFSEVVACDVDPETVRAHGARALILSGGPKSVYEPGAPALDPRLLELGIPVLGLCYGQQAMAQVLGVRVEATGAREYGRTSLRARPEGTLQFGDLPDSQVVWRSHGDTVTAPPPGARVLASTDASPVAGFEDPERGVFGVLFHP